MSDVRKELIEALWAVRVDESGYGVVADAILERFEVTPKPVVSHWELGRMCAVAFDDEHAANDYIGRRMLDQLDAAGLKVVRVSDDE